MSQASDTRVRIALDRGDGVFMVVVGASFVSLFLTAEPLPAPLLAGLLAAGAVYTFIGTYLWDRLVYYPGWHLRAAYFVVQFVLATAIVYFAQLTGAIWLVLMPLVSHAAFILSRRWAAVVAVAVVAIFLAVITIYNGFNLRSALMNSVTFGAAALFVALFSQLTRSEQEAREEGDRLAAELAEANRKLRSYAVQVEELATAKERNRLAREIHDSLGHYLTVINMQLAAAQAVLDSDRPRAVDALAKAQGLAQEGLAEVRRSVAALRASPLEGHTLAEGLVALVEECRTAGLAADLAVLGAPRPLAPQVELTVYRAVQEALTNVRKHAHATRVDVRLDYADPGRVRLTVEDNGVGTAEATGGFGLLGLRERAQLLGGTLEVTTAAGRGLLLELEVPTS